MRWMRAIMALGGGQCRIEHFLVHTGQHYDQRMSETFFKALGIPAADVDLGIGSGTHAEQVGQTMIAFEMVVREWKPDWIVDLLFTTDDIANANLRNEGTAEERIATVGNIMIDTLERHREDAEKQDLATILNDHRMEGAVAPASSEIQSGHFAVMTLHRPSNVDDPAILKQIMEFVTDELAESLPLVWPIHPRTLKNLRSAGLWERVQQNKKIVVLNPVGYLEMLKLNMDACIVLTDSGGLQEECCIFGTPCMTLRWNTERPKTLTRHGGESVLVGNDVDKISESFKRMIHEPKRPHRPPLWDGKTAQRIVARMVTA